MAAIHVPSTILGADGRPLVRQVLTEEGSGPTLTGVRQVLAEHPSQGLTPQRLGGIQRDAEQGDPDAYLALAEDLEEKFLHYRGVISTRRLAVAGLDITVEAASDDPIDIEAADLVRAVVEDDAFADVLFDLLDGIGKGYSVAEIVWETSARQWKPARIVHRDPTWFRLDRNDLRTLRLMEEGYIDGRDFDPFKFITHVPKTKSGIPIRGGIARPAAWAWLFTSFGTKDWLSFVETYGQPIRVGRYGPGASDADKAALLRAVRSISADAAAIIPQSMLIEFVRAEGASANADIFLRLVEFFERQTSKLVLGQTTTTDAVSGGHAVSQEHRQVQEDIERADARQLAVTLKRDLSEPMVKLNIGPRPGYPTIRIGRPQAEDLKLQLEALKGLIPLGLRVEASQVRDKFGFTDPAEGAELLGMPAKPQVPPQDVADVSPEPSTAAALAAAQAGGDVVDQLVDELLADYEPLAGPLVQSILAAAGEAENVEDFVTALVRIAGENRSAGLQEALARGQFMARIAARVGATGEGNE